MADKFYHPLGLIFCIALSFFSTLAQAAWMLDEQQSSLNYLTTKNSHITEINHFTNISGEITKNGIATLYIDIASVETNIPIRNERMQKHLFAAKKFPKITVSIDVGKTTLESLKQGQTKRYELPAKISMHGIEKTLKTQIIVSRDNMDNITATAAQPVVINASDFLLTDGIETLKNIAKLSSISYSVPVSFSLVYKKQ